ncbi:hypothetical protein BESB_037330 [Besnoitia besnoiti]|uniref:Uncharacterized protein n=1 Tax=Besnoitia besnoiti TaxID=94643 RepID=A0A2A9MH31_BESBE|nr:hypothetical protein BESB_037330 [Besnoitia besnoiti]PFH37275.1 hypothetical protein BESB_037330 [Besnoitia besnoiti]
MAHKSISLTLGGQGVPHFRRSSSGEAGTISHARLQVVFSLHYSSYCLSVPRSPLPSDISPPLSCTTRVAFSAPKRIASRTPVMRAFSGSLARRFGAPASGGGGSAAARNFCRRPRWRRPREAAETLATRDAELPLCYLSRRSDPPARTAALRGRQSAGQRERIAAVEAQSGDRAAPPREAAARFQAPPQAAPALPPKVSLLGASPASRVPLSRRLCRLFSGLCSSPPLSLPPREVCFRGARAFAVAAAPSAAVSAQPVERGRETRREAGEARFESLEARAAFRAEPASRLSFVVSFPPVSALRPVSSSAGLRSATLASSAACPSSSASLVRVSVSCFARASRLPSLAVSPSRRVLAPCLPLAPASPAAVLARRDPPTWVSSPLSSRSPRFRFATLADARARRPASLRPASAPRSVRWLRAASSLGTSAGSTEAGDRGDSEGDVCDPTEREATREKGDPGAEDGAAAPRRDGQEAKAKKVKEDERRVEGEEATLEDITASRLRGSFAASSFSLSPDVASSFSSESTPLSDAEELRLVEELETEERKAMAAGVQTAMQDLCRLVISRKNPEGATGGAPSGAPQEALLPQLIFEEGCETEASQGEREAAAASQQTREGGDWACEGQVPTKKREKELRRTHMRSQFGWIASAVDLQALMNEDPEFNEAVGVVAAMECPVIIRTKRLHQQLVPLSHGSTARIRQASKKLREALGISEVIVCRGCVKKSKCPLYRQPPIRLRSSEGSATTKDLLYVLFGQYMVCRLYTRGVDSKTVWAESDERTAYSKQLTASLLPSTMNARDLQMGLFAIEKLTEKVKAKIEEERKATERMAAAAARAGLGDEVRYNPLSLKAFRAFIEDGQARRSEKQEKIKEARALKMPLWIRDSVRPLPDTQLTKFQKKAIQFQRLAVDEPEPDCPLEERFVWMHESEEASAEKTEGDARPPQSKEEAEARQAIAVASGQDSALSALQPLVRLRERAEGGEAGVELPTLDDLPIQRRFAWRSPEGFPLRKRTLRFNLLYHYYLDRLKGQAARIPRFDVSAKTEDGDSAPTSSGAVFPEEGHEDTAPALLPAPQGGYSAVPLSSFSAENDQVHPLLHVDSKSLKGVAVYEHLSVRQMLESQQRIDRLWRTAALFEDLPVVHRITEREELADQSSGDASAALPSLPRLPVSARAHLRELERVRAEAEDESGRCEDRAPAPRGAASTQTHAGADKWIRLAADRTKLLGLAREAPAALSDADGWMGISRELEKRARAGSKRQAEGGRDAGCAGRMQSPPTAATSHLSQNGVQQLGDALPAWLSRDGESEQGEGAATSHWRPRAGGDPSARRDDRECEERSCRHLIAEPSAALESSSDWETASATGEAEPSGGRPPRSEENRIEKQEEEENDDALEEALFGDERRQARQIWKTAKRDRAAIEQRKKEIELASEVPPSIEEIQEQARSLRRAKADGDLQRARGRGRRRTLSDVLEDAEEDERRFQCWQAARLQMAEAEGGQDDGGAGAKQGGLREGGDATPQERHSAKELSERRNLVEKESHGDPDEDEPFHMADEGSGIRVPPKVQSERLRFGASTYTFVGCMYTTTNANPRPPSSSSSPAALPLLSSLDMCARSSVDHQPSDDGRALQELSSVDEQEFEVFVKPGRLERRGPRMEQKDACFPGDAKPNPETEAGRESAHRARAAARHETDDQMPMNSAVAQDDGKPQRRGDVGTDLSDDEDQVFRANFRVPLESDGGRPLGVDREEVQRSHVEMSRMQKSWRQNEDFLITRNVLYPKFVDLSQHAYGTHSPEGKEMRKQQVAANRANAQVSSLGSPTRRMPVSGLVQATMPDLSSLMRKESPRSGERRVEGGDDEEMIKVQTGRRRRADLREVERAQRERDAEAEEETFREKYGVVKSMEKEYRDKLRRNEMGSLVVNPMKTELQRRYRKKASVRT